MIISIGGYMGSGKSTIAKMLAAKLGWPRYYIGGIRREKARLKGLTLAEYNKLGETDPATDKEVDEYQKKLGEKEDNFVIEGRTSWYFIPRSLKIYLDVDEKIGAERIYNDLKNSDKRNEAAKIKSAADVLKSIKEREQSDTARYQKYYNIDAYDHNNYDYVIDTTDLSKDEVFNRVYRFVKKRLEAIDKK